MSLTCATGKVCFPTAKSAQHVLSMQRATEANPCKRIYRCPVCAQWHLTKHRPPYRRKRRRGQGYGGDS